MHSFFSDRNIRLYCEDVFTALQNIPAESIDLIFADPPYKLSNGGFSCTLNSKSSCKTSTEKIISQGKISFQFFLDEIRKITIKIWFKKMKNSNDFMLFSQYLSN